MVKINFPFEIFLWKSKNFPRNFNFYLIFSQNAQIFADFLFYFRSTKKISRNHEGYVDIYFNCLKSQIRA